ncbi:hypothetical protein [Bradyrhizobium sp.]|uniref:hypothetical protein n=1 Tax=Bradyrhizobium sp. TaxID=376 RepID=UPI002DDD87AA|nr:hypothetical protein [Bradyrhizobium sp.]HEV2160430.1 hypothetical protein [Bradyrhizobium sp.]
MLRGFGALGASTVTGGRLLLCACARDGNASTDTNTTEPNIVALIAAALPNQRCFLSNKATPTDDDPQFSST